MKRNRYIALRVRLFLVGVMNGKITLRKLWNVLMCNVAYLLQSKKTAASPYILSLELWNECNAGCLFCRDAKGVIYDVNPGAPPRGGISKGKMPFEMATEIIDQVKEKVLIAVLYTNGEPLLYKDLGKVIRFATERNVMTMIASNGLLFTEENIAEVLDAGIDFIKIQLSGYTQDIYSIQIRYGHVEKLKDNIRILARMNKERGSKTLVMIDYILYNYNKHQLQDVRAFCHELGLVMNIRPGNPKGGLEEKEAPLIKPQELPLKMSCDWLWKAMQVNYNGEILPCCEAVVYSGVKPYETYAVGQTKVKDVWNGSAAIRMRNTMTTQGRGVIPICSRCSRQGVCFKW